MYYFASWVDCSRIFGLPMAINLYVFPRVPSLTEVGSDDELRIRRLFPAPGSLPLNRSHIEPLPAF
jgi:hypothetical protein